jgi:hypothetical protein
MPEVAEWLIATDLKSVVRVNAPGVRIPLSPHHESPFFGAFTFSINAKSPDSRQGFFITSYSFSYLPDHRYTAMQLLYSISSSIQSRTRWEIQRLLPEKCSRALNVKSPHAHQGFLLAPIPFCTDTPGGRPLP